MKYLISACLMGHNCKYNGGNNYHEQLVSFMNGSEVICVCPEMLGGLSTPRPCAEIKDGRVVNQEHVDVTDAFQIGAIRALQIAKDEAVDLAITQPRSPSCGKGKRYSGNFDNILVEGNGIFVDYMQREGFSVLDVEEFLTNKMK